MFLIPLSIRPTRYTMSDVLITCYDADIVFLERFCYNGVLGCARNVYVTTQ